MSVATPNASLLERSYNFAFDRLDPATIEPTIDRLLAEAKDRLQAVVDHTGPRDYAHTLGALESLTETLDWAMGIIGHLESVATTPELREAYNAVQGRVSAFHASIPLNPGLWSAIKAFADSDEAKALDPTRGRLLQLTLDNFRRRGAQLSDDRKRRLEQLESELAELTNQFSQQVVDATAAYELIIDDEDRLSGLPESARAAAAASAKSVDKQGYRFTLQAPSVIPVLSYLDDAAIREQLWRAFSTRASSDKFDNRPLLGKILSLRREKAQLLGYDDFSDLVLEDRMAKTGAKAQAFVHDLENRSRAAFERETEELTAFRRELEGDGTPPLNPWDVSYYAEKQRRALYDFDEEALRPYFPVNKVLSGMFQLVHKLYGIDVKPVEGYAVWHPSVECYAVYDGERELGIFYADLFPRESKRAGAWMNYLITGRSESDPEGHSPHLGLICGNITPPLDDRPALLTHREVETLFHEFGHLLHHLLTKVEIVSLAGVNVAWDFVELPSQIMENWCWEREALDLFARHHETGATIPDELFEKMRRARTFRSASAMMRQLSFATVDLELHREFDPAGEEPALQRALKVARRFSATELPEDYAMLCAFTHLFASPVAYAAGYYSYKWAEVLDADAFTAFKEAGIFDREVGLKFRRCILERGNSRDPSELYRDFMGRDPELSALLKRSGLAA